MPLLVVCILLKLYDGNVFHILDNKRKIPAHSFKIIQIIL